MPILTTTCPHCRTEHVAAQFVGFVQQPEMVYRHNKGQCVLYTTFFACQKCHKGICAQVISTTSDSPAGYSGDLLDSPYLTIESIYPMAGEHKAPPHAPSSVERVFIQAKDNLSRHQWEAAGAMYRKALDIATKEKAPSKKGGNLASRIDHLAKEGVITEAMQGWAHAIRIDGNEAAHEDEAIDEATATDLHAFTELFLMYAYTLPGMMQERRQRKSPPEEAAEA